ncbi:MAG: MT-A70 family methyltransferase [Pseudomonadota bacterium]
MTEKKYGVIYADPPWYFKNYSAKGTGRAAISHYDVMSQDELKSYPVRDYAAKDCALFLWATDPMLPQAISVMEGWGFTYKTVAFTWVKTNKNAKEKTLAENPFFTGLGYWTRANAEICLMGTIGKPKRLAKDVRRLLVSERREHSRKPDETYRRIERLVSGPYLELFARQRQQGWDAVGKEADRCDDLGKRRRQPSRIKTKGDVNQQVTDRYAAE